MTVLEEARTATRDDVCHTICCDLSLAICGAEVNEPVCIPQCRDCVSCPDCELVMDFPCEGCSG
jgi:hypothetical protein